MRSARSANRRARTRTGRPGLDGEAQAQLIVESNEMTGKGCRAGDLSRRQRLISVPRRLAIQTVEREFQTVNVSNEREGNPV